MGKIFYIILSIILLASIFIFPSFTAVFGTIKDGIVFLNTDFFAKMPAWFNFLIASCGLTLIFAIANNFRK